MIGIFQGRGILEEDTIYAKIAVEMRQHLHEFNDGRSFSSLAVFLCIALHANEDGWAWPSRATIMKETGLSTQATLTRALAHLRQATVCGERLFAHYREHTDKERWGRTAYLIFPDIDHGPPPFRNMAEYDPRAKGVPDTSEFLYLIQTNRGFKLGTSRKLAQRLGKLRYTHGDSYQLMAYYQAVDSEKDNQMWHSQWIDQHQRGYWYDLQPDHATAFIQYALAHGGSIERERNAQIKLEPMVSEPLVAGTQVARTLHEVEPLKEEPSKEISGSSSPGDPPPPITAAEPELEGDAALDAAFGPRPEREPPNATGNWAVPAAAGGSDLIAEALADKICRFNGLSGFETLPKGKRVSWVRQLSEMIHQWGGATEDELRLAWSAWREAYGWHGRCDPFYTSFGNEFGPLLVGVQEEGQRKGKPKVVSWRDDERWQDVGDGPMVVREERHG